jgi:hypothetical protein
MCVIVKAGDHAGRRLVSVLTAVGRGDHSHLRDAYESLLTQAGVAREWVMQVDGAEVQVPEC